MGGFFPRGNGEDGAGGPIPARSGTTFTDRRMKTNTVLYPNGPRDSSVSLQDNEDYSRPVLRVSWTLHFRSWPDVLANCVISSLPTPTKFGMTIQPPFLSLPSSGAFQPPLISSHSKTAPLWYPFVARSPFPFSLPFLWVQLWRAQRGTAARESGRPLLHRQGAVLRVHALVLAHQNTLDWCRKYPELKSMVHPRPHETPSRATHTLSCIHTRHIGDDSSPCWHVLKVYIHRRLSVRLASPASGLVAFLAFIILAIICSNMLISFTCLLFICRVPLSLFCRCPRLNCLCICYGFDLRGYDPGAVLRLTDSMKPPYAWGKYCWPLAPAVWVRLSVNWFGVLSLMSDLGARVTAVKHASFASRVRTLLCRFRGLLPV